MKRKLSLILGALILASSLSSCGGTTPKETEAEDKIAETAITETSPAESNVPETKDPDAGTVSYAVDKVTENGIALSHIVLAEGADQLEQYAAEELAYHIKKVSGADIPVVSAPAGESLPIIIGTPDTVSALAELFPEDIEWLTELKDEDGKNWGSDGFSIRQTEDALYIFGATSRGALNGVYEFIEENMGVLWVRADEEIGLIYDEMPTITIEKAGYREKSPFEYRATTLGNISFEETQVLYARNKLNTISGADKFKKEDGVWNVDEIWIVQHDNFGHCLKFWVRNSPIYDPECTEYWNVDEFGNPKPDGITQINFWSEKTLETVTAAILELLGQHPDIKSVPIAIEDGLLEKAHCSNPPYSDRPYEYAEGQFVNPDDKAFHSTVVYSFINKVAKRVAEEYPEVMILTYAYHNTITPPLCDIEPNVGVVFTPIEECMADPIASEENPHNEVILKLINEWSKVPNELGVYEYYFCTYALPDYERPIWYKMQTDIQLYAEKGVTRFISQGSADGGAENKDAIHYLTGKTHSDNWAMNSLSLWIYSKLLWNPEEDVDALIEYFCDKVYGDASEYMKEYYGLLYQGWIEGESEIHLWNFKLDASYYIDYFVYMVDLEDDIVNALRNAYDAADEGAKERIRYIKETYEKHFPEE